MDMAAAKPNVIHPVAATLLLCLAACGSRLTQENFEKVHKGMLQQQVRKILGEPADASGASFFGLSSAGAV